MMSGPVSAAHGSGFEDEIQAEHFHERYRKIKDGLGERNLDAPGLPGGNLSRIEIGRCHAQTGEPAGFPLSVLPAHRAFLALELHERFVEDGGNAAGGVVVVSAERTAFARVTSTPLRAGDSECG